MFDSPAWAAAIALFFCIYIFLHAYRFDNQEKNLFIAVSSLIFYAAWNPHAAVGLILIVCAVYVFNQLDVKGEVAPIFILTALAILAASKYWKGMPQLMGMPSDYKQPFFIIGISFYIFTVVGYFVDVAYRGEKPLEKIRDIAVLVSFWPHLAAGPILRLEHMRAGLLKKNPLTDQILRLAVVLVLGGLGKKFLIADGIGVYIDANLGTDGSGVMEMNGFQALVTLIGFGTQIYFDFSGYSDIAIGCAYLMGFRLLANFNYPYAAASLTEFWRRWHISLSTWFRDYLFIPLGGSRRGNVYVNLLFVFGLSGIWHGIGRSFLVWGLIHGCFVCLEKRADSWFIQIPYAFRRFYVIVVVMGAWAFFRLDTAYAIQWLKKILSFSSYTTSLESPYYVVPIVFFIGMLVIDHLVKYYRVGEDGFISEKVPAARSAYAFATYLLFLLFHGKTLPFIYFKF